MDIKKEPSDNGDSKITEKGKDAKHIKWSPENELIMVEWCDIAQCYTWLHTKSYNRLSIADACFTIPTITLSTITGTASFAQTSLPLHIQPYAPLVIGTINILIGFLTTVQQYLKISERNGSHRMASIQWDKFARNIRIELSKEPDERMEAGHFIKLCRLEFDRYMETSPAISDIVIKKFIKTFKGKPDSIERHHFDELKKPDICNTIISANESRHNWYKYDNNNNIDFNHRELEDNIRNRMKYEQLRNESFEDNRNIHNEIIDNYVNNFTQPVGIKSRTNEIVISPNNEVGSELVNSYNDDDGPTIYV
jgi:hypothetical protein